MAHFRYILRLLMVVTLALGFASAPLSVLVQAAEPAAAARHHHGPMAQVAQGSPDHDHVSLARPYAMGQTCCHPGCIMAVVPGFASLPPAHLTWVTVPIRQGTRVIPAASSGPDRPPKLA